MTHLNLDMDSNALHDWIASNGPVHVVFNANVDEKENYAEEGIQCIITSVVKKDPEYYALMVDYTPFEVLNSLYESSNYYGPAPVGDKTDKRPGYLSAYATQFYKRENTLYVEPNEKIGVFVHSIQPASVLAVTADAVEQRFSALKKELQEFSF